MLALAIGDHTQFFPALKICISAHSSASTQSNKAFTAALSAEYTHADKMVQVGLSK